MLSQAYRFFVAGLVAFALAGCATPNLGTYQGADAGYVVASLAAQKGTNYGSYRLMIRTVGDRKEAGSITWFQDNMFSSDKPDFNDATETGMVNAIRMQPGDYEIYDFDVYRGGYPVEVTYRAQKEFSIPFSVHAGEAVYLGEFMAVTIWGKNIFGITIPGGPYFVITDKQARDIGPAKVRQPAITAVRNAVPNADGLGIPIFRSTPLPPQR